MSINVPFLDYATIRGYATGFLQQHHPSQKVPVPIDEIIEFDLGLDIVPSPNLWRNFDISAYLSKDRTRIFIDQQQFEQYEQKYRFTLAHEIAHYHLHKEIFELADYKDAVEYNVWRAQIPDSAQKGLEIQANDFAGLVLVPETILESTCLKILEDKKTELAQLDCAEEMYWKIVAHYLGEEFNVAPITAQLLPKYE